MSEKAVFFRLTKKDHAKIQHHAEREGLSVSGYARRATLLMARGLLVQSRRKR